jgi:hypothetical protein
MSADNGVTVIKRIKADKSKTTTLKKRRGCGVSSEFLFFFLPYFFFDLRYVFWLLTC